MTLLLDGIDQSKIFFEEPIFEPDAIQQLQAEGAKESLEIILKELFNSSWDGRDLEEGKKLINNSAKLSNLKKGLLMRSLRAALLGTMKGPDLLTTFGLLSEAGKSIKRIQASLSQ